MKSLRDFISRQARTNASVLSALFLLLLTLPAAAAPNAHPALWHIKGPQGEVWLLGSIHALPPDIDWHTREIERAIARADVFVFETPTDAAATARMQGLVAAHGKLMPGQSLRAMLAPEAQSDLDGVLALYHLPPGAIDDDRPWLASLVFDLLEMKKEGFAPEQGVDRVVGAEAAGRPLRYFETTEQQFALVAPDDSALELEEFESDLKDFRRNGFSLAPLADAWRHGDTARLGRLMNADLDKFPAAKKALLTERNARWALQIQTMLTEKRRFFITVGAAHLAGPQSVPALLRRAGYAVEGP